MFKYNRDVWTYNIKFKKKMNVFLPKWILGFADFIFFMKKDKATSGQLSVHEKVKQTA